MSEGAAKKEGFGEKPQPKEKPRKFQAIRGTRDLLPPETALWNHVEQTAHEVFATFGFGEIRVPIFEPTELFARAVGDETDIVSKEMYTLVERSEKLDLHTSIGNLDGFLQKVEELQQSGEIPPDKVALSLVRAKWTQVNKLLAENAESANPARDIAIYELIMLFESLKLGNDISLRPEATASVCRAYIEHNMQQLPQPVKLYYLGPMFRRERPQKGRYRQFYQIGAEVLEREVASGEWRVASQKEAATDAEVIEMVMTFFEKVGLEGVELHVNSIGHSEPPVDGKSVCRRAYVEKLRAELLKVKDKLGADSQRRIETNPLRVLDSKLESEQKIIEKLPRIGDHLCTDCATHYAAVKHQLQLRGVVYRENWRLVRGLDYYMRTTFEITAQGLGSQNAVCGGGRYDGLVELLGGPPTKGIGFAIGEDRLILSLQESGKGVASGEWRVASKERKGVASGRLGIEIYIAWMGEKAQATAIRAAKDLRKAGFSVELPPVEQKFGKALGQADKLGAKYALILGDHEVSSGEWTLKTLADGTQKKLPEPQIIEELRKTR